MRLVSATTNSIRIPASFVLRSEFVGGSWVCVAVEASSRSPNPDNALLRRSLGVVVDDGLDGAARGLQKQTLACLSFGRLPLLNALNLDG